MRYLAHMGISDYDTGYDYGFGMMGPGMMNTPWFWLGGLTWIVWTIVGILVIVWLWKQVKK